MNRSYSKIRHIQEANQRLEKRLLNEQEEGDYEYEIRAVDCGDDVDEGQVGLSEYSDKIMIAYCKENPESLEHLKHKGRMLVKQRHTIPDFSDDDQDSLSKMRGYFGDK